MFRIKYLLMILIFGCVIQSGALLGQPNFQFTLQTWGTHTTYDNYDWNADSTVMEFKETTTQLGFGIRRARLRGKMTKGNITGFIQYDAAANVMHDAQVDYAFSKNLKIRMGRFVGPGSQAGGRTSHTAIDFAERSIVGRLWASAVSRADYRSYGLSVIHKIGVIQYEIMASNGDGSINFKPYNTKSSNSKVNTGNFPQLDFMIYSKFSNGLSGGVHFGLPNEDRCGVSSLTGFLYFHPHKYKKGSFRGKFDFAQVVYHGSESNVISFGYAIKGFYRLAKKMEIGAGYENWDNNVDTDNDAFGNFLVGLNYSPNPEHWKDTLFKLVATFKTSEVENQPYDPFIVHFVWQVYMH